MIQQNINLQPYNTFGLAVNAANFCEFSNIEELKDAISKFKDQPLLVLGGGSNMLLTKDVQGLVLKNNLKGIELVKEVGNDVWIKSMAGEVWHDLVMYAIENGYGGIENLSLIPGSVGAAPMQNIGAYGVEVKDVFDSLEAYNIENGNIEVFTNDQCQFGYRESVFKRSLKGKYIIVSVTLKLTKHSEINTSYGAIASELENMGVSQAGIKEVSQAVINIRQSKLPDPKEIGNSGSFFKNPVIGKSQFEQLKAKFPDIVNYPVDENHVKIAAGWLIDQAGWKGKTIGNYGVHKNQALVLVNYGGAKGQDIYQLSEDIMKSVKDIYGIDLEREVNVI
ncbi:UDP-N-acetylmuramate dehydrogenase [Paracrocinitomix mangrovi]|uniref:UDP-N-acetylmuramate dehydrogenase n=1 Tax=Paracrocinitomix mangrovi TaxID=2862509 RepID=UPI001C8E17BD|nr:UDP-N-acetylmuramate dehydrogenase [Paracrocinitomix mangrovi]UKN03121.1 UDP-N-acetylmuramate dehydrogenase [Paracrocinitomix mangrovi]